MKYSRKQIFEAIKYWKKQLSTISESTELAVDDVTIKVYTDSDEIDNLIENVIDMVIKTYHKLGGYYGQTDPKRLKRTTSMIKCIYDVNQKMIACSFYRNVDGSFKLQAYGHNGQQNGKDGVKAIIHSDVMQYKDWVWGEVSGGPEKYFKIFQGYPLPNELVSIALSKNDKDIQLSEDGFHYKRVIANNQDVTEKVVFGFKNKELFDEAMENADYEMLRNEFNLKDLNESENPFVIKSFKAACSFINQLSDMYDEKNLCQLPPGLSSMLDQSIIILKDNLNTASWVNKTLEDAEYLRDNISTITCVSNVI